MMHDIQTLRRYRRKGIHLLPDEKIRLYQFDCRRRKALLRVWNKAKWLIGLAVIIMLYRAASFTARGYEAVGAEMFFPLVLIFALWIRSESNEKK